MFDVFRIKSLSGGYVKKESGIIVEFSGKFVYNEQSLQNKLPFHCLM